MKRNYKILIYLLFTLVIANFSDTLQAQYTYSSNRKIEFSDAGSNMFLSSFNNELRRQSELTRSQLKINNKISKNNFSSTTLTIA